jgi:hypothetical protein
MISISTGGTLRRAHAPLGMLSAKRVTSATGEPWASLRQKFEPRRQTRIRQAKTFEDESNG